MLVTKFTRRALAVRRERRDMPKLGWELVGERGGKLWELHRGNRTHHRIVQTMPALCGKAIWMKTKAAE